MDDRLLLKGIEETREEDLEVVDGTLTSDLVPEFAKMILHYRDGQTVVFPKILTKLTFPTAGIMMIVKRDRDEPELVIINMAMTGSKEDIISVSMFDLPPEEESDEDV